MKKAHKTRRQQLAEKAAVAKKHVDKANALKDPLNSLFSEYKTADGATVTIECSKIADIKEDTLKWIFDLMERNMKHMYEQTQWGWNAESKQKELTEPTAWYLIAKDSQDKRLGFCHFRFDIDYGTEVLYCYELQIEPTTRRIGLGTFMMAALESMATEYAMQKVVLTLFKRNFAAVPFFYGLGYKLDETSPAESEDLHYVILSKKA